MNQITGFWITLSLLLAASLAAGPGGSVSADLLFEYGCAYFGEEGYTAPDPSNPLLPPPNLTIYQDGYFFMRREGVIKSGRVEKTRLEKIKKTLARHPILKKSTGHDIPGKGATPLMHGGLCYVRYAPTIASQPQLRAVGHIPTSRAWKNLTKFIERTPAENAWRPASVSFLVAEADEGSIVEMRKLIGLPTLRDWPFPETIDLATSPKGIPIVATDPKIIDYLLNHLPYQRSWTFQQDGQSFTLALVAATPWYDPIPLERQIWDLLH